MTQSPKFNKQPPAREMGCIGAPRVSAKAQVLAAYPGARPDRWPAVDRRVRICAVDGSVVGIGNSTLEAWGDGSRRLKAANKT